MNSPASAGYKIRRKIYPVSGYFSLVKNPEVQKMKETKPLRSRFLTRISNSEVETYLEYNDIIFVPVGVVEMHGIFTLDAETVVSEALALKLAEAADGLVLNNLPYFYAGATAIGRGTVQVSIRTGIDYLYAIARSLLEKGFKRQIYISFHGPAELTVKPVIRDFFDDTKVPILYIDPTNYILGDMSSLSDPAQIMEKVYSIFYGAYDIMGRLDEVPLVSELPADKINTDSFTGGAFQFGYLPGKFGFYFAEKSDHNAAVPQMKTAEERQAFADKGKKHIDEFVSSLKINEATEKMRTLEEFTRKEVLKKYGTWLPRNR
jgi:creatinine amidohydrolase